MPLWMMIVLGILGGVLGITWLVGLFRAGKPIRRLLGSGVQGACALAAVNVTGALTGVSLGLNWLSGIVCTVLGVPGVILLLILKVVFEI